MGCSSGWWGDSELEDLLMLLRPLMFGLGVKSSAAFQRRNSEQIRCFPRVFPSTETAMDFRGVKEDSASFQYQFGGHW